MPNIAFSISKGRDVQLVRNVKASLFVILVGVWLLAASQITKAATPVGKNHTSIEYSQDCGSGRRGVGCVALSVIELTWDTPLLREDGSILALNEISHYVVEISTGVGNNRYIDVPKSNSIRLKLNIGTYFFRIATVDSALLMGAFSQQITQSI